MAKALLIVLALVLPLAGCGDDDITTPDSSTSTYTLQTVDGAPLPATISAAGPYRLEVTAGEVILKGDGTFSSSFSLRETTPEGVRSSTSGSEGTYRQEQDALLFRTANGQEYPGSLTGNTLTMVISGNTYVLQK